MPSGCDFGRFPTIFDDVPGDMHCASDMPHVENLTPPLDSANPKVMEMSPMRVKPDHTRGKPKHGPRVKYLAIFDALRTDLV